MQRPPPGTLRWNADIGFTGLNISKPIAGSSVSDATGSIKVDQSAANITADAILGKGIFYRCQHGLF